MLREVEFTKIVLEGLKPSAICCGGNRNMVVEFQLGNFKKESEVKSVSLAKSELTGFTPIPVHSEMDVLKVIFYEAKGSSKKTLLGTITAPITDFTEKSERPFPLENQPKGLNLSAFLQWTEIRKTEAPQIKGNHGIVVIRDVKILNYSSFEGVIDVFYVIDVDTQSATSSHVPQDSDLSWGLIHEFDLSNGNGYITINFCCQADDEEKFLGFKRIEVAEVLDLKEPFFFEEELQFDSATEDGTSIYVGICQFIIEYIPDPYQVNRSPPPASQETMRLKVTVLEATDPIRSSGETADAYCVLQLGEKTFKTAPRAGNLLPKWNESTIFDLDSFEMDLELAVWDRQALDGEGFLGMATIPIADIKDQTQPTVIAVQLSSRVEHTDQVSGAIALKLEINKVLLPATKGQQPASKPTIVSPNVIGGVEDEKKHKPPSHQVLDSAALNSLPVAHSSTTQLIVEVLNSENIDVGKGAMNIFFVLRCGSATQRSTAKHGINITWNETFPFQNLPSKDFLQIECWEDIKPPNFIGYLRIEVTELESIRSKSTKAYTLSPNPKTLDLQNGSIVLSIYWKDQAPVKQESVAAQSSTTRRAIRKSRKLKLADVERNWRGEVSFEAISGRGLAIKDVTGKSDPYLKIKCGKQELKTKIIMESLDPVWNQSFPFLIEKRETMILVECWDFDRFSGHDFMGEFYVDVREFEGNKRIERTYTLQANPKYDEEVSGTITVALTYKHPRLPTPMLSAATSQASLPVGNQKEAPQGYRGPGTLIVTIISASNLTAKDIAIFGKNTSDPYCVITVDGVGEVGRTTVKDKNLNPEWNEVFQAFLPSLDGIMHVELFDKDQIKDDFLGKAIFPLEMLAEVNECTRDFKLLADPVKYKGESVSGGVLFKVAYEPKPLDQLTEQEKQKIASAPKEPKAQKQGKLLLKIIAARNLKSVDSNGKSDPFCKIHIKDYSTPLKTITKPKTLDPVWNFQTVIDRPHLEIPIKIEVFDENRFRDKLLGTITYKFKKPSDGRSVEEWIGFDNKQDPGEVHIAWQYTTSLEKIMEFDEQMQRAAERRDAKKSGAELYLEVIGAKSLLDADRSGTSDPYVELNLGGESWKTSCIKKTLNPQWNECHIFAVTDLGATLNLKVMDQNDFMKNVVIGELNLSMNYFKDEIARDEWHELPKGQSEKARGWIHIRSCYSTQLRGEQEYKKLEYIKGLEPIIEENYLEGQILVHVIEAKGLLAMDPGGTSDPYCIIKVGKQTQKTKVIPKTLNPFWNEKLSFDVTQESTTILFDVYDKDFGSSDDFIGSAKIIMAEVISQKTYKQVLSLNPPNSGEIHIAITHATTEAELAELERAKKKNLENMIGGKQGAILHVGVIEARNLLAADRQGTSDPYCKVTIQGKSQKTEIIDAQLNPTWNQTLVFKGITEVKGTIMIEVLDHDKFSTDDSLGIVEIPLADTREEVLDQWYDLKPKSKGAEARGSVHISTFFSLDDGDATLLKTMTLKTIEPPKKEGGRILIDIVEAEDLRSADSNGLSDPFCEVKLGAQTFKTPVVKKNLNPIWNVQKALDVTPEAKELVIRVMDQDMFGSDFLGQVVIPLESKLDEMPHDEWFDLQKGVGKEAETLVKGRIHVRLRFALSQESLQQIAKEEKMSAVRQKKGALGAKLRIRIISARNLKAMDDNGKSDPYVKVKVGTFEYETKVIPENVHPQWDESTQTNILDMKAYVSLRVFDWNKFTKHAMIGECQIPVSTLVGQDAIDQWHSLIPAPGLEGEVGDIRVELQLISNNLVDPESMGNPMRGKVYVKVKAGNNLKSADFNGLSDPFYVIKIGEAQTKSSIQYNTLNPRWNEQYTLDVTHSKLRIEVYDYDFGNPSDFLGLIVIDLSKEKLNQTIERTIPLESDGETDGVSGDLIVNFRYYPEDVFDADFLNQKEREYTKLHEAIITNNVEETVKLIRSKAVVNCRDPKGLTPLHWATFTGNIRIIKVLTEAGALIDVADDKGWSPLMHAAQLGHVEAMKFLLEKGASITLKDKHSRTPLIEAALRGRLECCQLLIEKEADVNATDEEGMTALHWAAFNNQLELVKKLVQLKSSTRAKDRKGFTPLRLALAKGNKECVDFLSKGE